MCRRRMQPQCLDVLWSKNCIKHICLRWKKKKKKIHTFATSNNGCLIIWCNNLCNIYDSLENHYFSVLRIDSTNRAHRSACFVEQRRQIHLLVHIWKRGQSNKRNKAVNNPKQTRIESNWRTVGRCNEIQCLQRRRIQSHILTTGDKEREREIRDILNLFFKVIVLLTWCKSKCLKRQEPCDVA